MRDALVRHCRQQGVRFAQGRALSLVTREDGIAALRTQEGELGCDAVILATGGLSYPATGSTGDGYRMAREAGHTIVDPRPSLVPIVTRESWPQRVMGLSLRNVALTMWREGDRRPLFREQGELLFTHFGLSGPLVLTASTLIREGRVFPFPSTASPR